MDDARRAPMDIHLVEILPDFNPSLLKSTSVANCIIPKNIQFANLDICLWQTSKVTPKRVYLGAGLLIRRNT
jgi:hypothetical protein